MNRRPREHRELEARLGYRFADPELLDRALTHSSAVSPGKRIAQSYQRLEFLGDRVLGLVVADMLYRRLPKANEGDLNRTLVGLVRGETCAQIAREVAVGSELNLGESEKRTGGAENDAILGDVAEAIIGAIFLDGGMGPAYSFIERLLDSRIDVAANRGPDAKTTLQEWAQSRGLEPPDYVLVGQTGLQHAPQFTIAVQLNGFEPLSATGASKKIAEHKAAQAFLVREKVWKGTE